MVSVEIDYKSKFYYPGSTFENNQGLIAVVLGRVVDSKSKNFLVSFEDGAQGIYGCCYLKTGRFSYPISLTSGNNNSDNPYRTVWKRYELMLNRCNNPEARDYRRYGGRGIKCDFLKVYRFFMELKKDANWPLLLKFPDRYEVDRVDNNGNYCPGNLRIVTKSQNQRNKHNNHIYNLIDNKTEAVLFSGIKIDCEYWLRTTYGIKTAIDQTSPKKEMGKSKGFSIRHERLL